MRNDLPDIPAETGMPPDDGSEDPPGLPLAVGWIAYAGALVIFGVSQQLALYPWVVYFACGILLTRFVLRGLVVLHPMHATISNEFWMKVRMALLWPLQMLILLVQLTVTRIL